MQPALFVEHWPCEDRLISDCHFIYKKIGGKNGREPPLPAAHFLHRAQVESGKAIPGWTIEAMLALIAHSWPGNVRELENEIAQAVARCEAGKALEPACFSESLFAMGGSVPVGKGGLKDRLEVMERWMVLEALSQCKGVNDVGRSER